MVISPFQEFLAEVEGFLERNRISATAFGRLSLKDPNFVRDLRKGREPKWARVQRVRDFMNCWAAQEPAQ